MNFKTIEWRDDKVFMIDQRLLPLEEVYVECSDYKQVADAIKNMVIRGAPAIGVAAAMGVALGALGIGAKDHDSFLKKLQSIAESLNVRPTAINLKWALQHMLSTVSHNPNLSVEAMKDILRLEAIRICEEDIEINRQMGSWGQTLITSGQNILTHCNAGALATAGWGTALGVVYSAQEAGKKVHVYADETRPFLQGARLTAWELQKNNVPVTLITDNMAASFMKAGKIDLVIVGADRIAANGDVANKIGTYGVALLAHYHKIPFYVAAPLSTIDIHCPSGQEIPIEERPLEEVTHFYRQRISPDGISVRNPAFDVTPNELVSAIVTEKGIIKSPYTESIRKLF